MSWIDRISVVLIAISGGLLAVMMGLTVTDVVGRYFFNAPLRGAFEMTQLLLAAMIFTALPATTHDRAHVTVELFPSLPGGAGVWQDRIVALVCAPVLALLTWRLALLAGRMTRLGDRSTELSFDLGLIGYGMCGLTGLACGAAVLPLFRSRGARP